MNLKETSVNSSSPQTVETGMLEIKKANELLLQNLLNGSLILGTILVFINLYYAIQTGSFISATLILTTFGVLFLATFARSLAYQFRVVILSLCYFLAGTFSLIQLGLNANGVLYFLVSVLLLGLLLSRRFWIFSIILIAVTVAAIGVLIQIGIIKIGTFIVASSSILYWISVSVNLIFLIFLITAPLTQYLQKLRSSIVSTYQKNDSIQNENQVLSGKLLDFENTLDRRRSRLVTTRQISREVSQQTNLDSLLHDSVDLIRSQLGYYYAGIFLNDERNENTFLRAATGEIGKSLMERNYRLRIRDEGIVGLVITHGEARVSFDIAASSLHNQTLILPNTKSELAVPLRVGQRVIGALDVQSDRTEAFGEEDMDILQGIADQLSTVIDKTAQITVLKQNIQSLEEGYRSYTQGVWQTHLKDSKKQLSYVYSENSLGTEFDKSTISDDALLRGEVIIAPASSAGNPDENESIVAVPIILRDQVLGVLNIKYKGKNVPTDLVALVNNASDRLALALENARLLEQIQERAEREHLVGDISAKVRAASDIDTILRTAATELGRSLGIDEVRIQLKTAE